MTTFYTYTQSPVGRLMLTANDHALTGLYFSTGKKARTTPDDCWRRSDTHFQQARQERDEYFEHRRRCFDVALEPCATPFQSRVLEALRAIPYGEVRSYKQIAEAIGSPKAMRAVGNANGNNPLAIFIPCHRVVGSNGALTGFGGGLEAKQYLLGLELD